MDYSIMKCRDTEYILTVVNMDREAAKEIFSIGMWYGWIERLTPPNLQYSVYSLSGTNVEKLVDKVKEILDKTREERA